MISQRQLYAWLFLGLVLVFATRTMGFGTVSGLKTTLSNFNIFVWGAVGVVGRRIYSEHQHHAASRFELAAGLAIAVSALVSTLVVSGFGLGVPFCLMGALVLCFAWRSDHLRAAAITLFALATYVTFAPVVFRLFIDDILFIDAALLGSVMHFLRPDIIWTNTTFESTVSGRFFGMTLVGGCSSFAGVSIAVLVHVAWAMAMRSKLTWYDALAVVITGILVVGINLLRLVLITWDLESYNFWHGVNGDGPGIIVFHVLQTVTIAMAGWITAYWAGRLST